MAASRAQIEHVRNMTTETLDDDQIGEIIERYPLRDERGTPPYTWDTSTTPPTQDANDDWIPTYDLNAAAADIWEQTAATYAAHFDFETNDQKFDRSQKHAHAMKMVRHFRSKRAPTSFGMVGVSKEGSANPATWIGNLPEDDD